MKGKRAILLPLIAVIVTAGSMWVTNRVSVSKEVTWEDVLAEAKSGGYQIITTEELWKRYQKNPGSLLLVDTRQEWEYQTGHIKGALNFPVEPTWWSTLLKRGQLKAFLGPDKNRLIVFY
jgi:3-mercaptopyruvate sulfurtransferase SseA